jgi:hypothetical protein
MEPFPMTALPSTEIPVLQDKLHLHQRLLHKH